MAADIALILFFVAAFLLGLFRGSVRQLIALGAWLVTFIVAAYLRGPVGDWIGNQAREYSPDYVEMLAFGLTFVVLFAVALLVIEIGGKTIHLTQRVAVDEVIGGFLALGVAVLTVGALMIILGSYYATNPPPGAADLDIVRQLNSAFDNSGLANSFRGSLVRGLLALLGPLLPGDIRAVYA